MPEMQPSFIPLKFPQDSERLIAFLENEEWPFHVNAKLTRQKIEAMIVSGTFNGSNHQCFWILDKNKNEVGFLRLIDLDDVDDGYPLFDLRLRKQDRGQGMGKMALRWLTSHLFEKYPQLDRIAGNTRADNLPMRKTFLACGYVKEGHARKDWEDAYGKKHDSLKYAILREDWQSGAITPVDWQA